MIATLANANRDPKVRPRPFTPSECNPFKKPEPDTFIGVKELREMLRS